MADTLILPDAVLEVVSPDRKRRFVRITQSPFLIGRGEETGNHLNLTDRRISRQCAAIIFEGGKFYLEDRGQRRGLFVNGEKAENPALSAGDSITFGLEDSYEIIFRTSAAEEGIPNLLTRIGGMTMSGSGFSPSAGGLGKLNLLLEATTLLHSQLPLDSVLGTMLDHSVAVTDADRGLLLVPNEGDPGGMLNVQLARKRGATRLSPESITPSQTAVRQAIEKHGAIVTEDLAQAGVDLQAAQSIVAQRLRSIVVIPLYAASRANTMESAIEPRHSTFLGVLYLDSTRPAAFSKLDRQILDALAVEAASILDNARLVERERERQRMEQEIGIARDIQQALLPHGLKDYPHLAVSGINFPCLAVGGDYFDVFPIGEEQTAFLLADVSGKGLGAALVTTMLQGALTGMTLGADPALVLNRISDFLCEHSEVGRYATMFFGILNRNGELEYINAGHPSPVLLRGGKAEAPFTEGSFPVGLVPDTEYSCSRIKLEPNDTLVLFSDGVTEAMDPEEAMYGTERLLELLNGQEESPLADLQKNILESVENFTRGARQADDVTLLLVRYRAAAQAATV